MAFRPDRFREAREKRGLTQQDLGRLLGLGLNQISRYETGINDPSTAIVTALAQELGVTADYLLGLSDHPSAASSADLRDDERELLAAYTVGDAVKIMQLSVIRLRQLRGEG